MCMRIWVAGIIGLMMGGWEWDVDLVIGLQVSEGIWRIWIGGGAQTEISFFFLKKKEKGRKNEKMKNKKKSGRFLYIVIVIYIYSQSACYS
ncbi:hypothetical protein DFH27DRAFT_65393 [Peziza echinospora]|nr:hypothetical protein DFH27DRAFT_65393 [Peziza echinospora]